MSKFIKHTGRSDAVIFHVGDTHCGSKLFHEDAYNHMLDMAIEDDAFICHMGDCIEGKPTKSSHFDPSSLEPELLVIDDQIEYFANIMRRVADRTLSINWGNHELYLEPDKHIVKEICYRMGVPHVEGGYQTWIRFGDVTMHNWHGRPSMPQGGEDPYKREAAKKSWLKRKMRDLAGSAHAHYMGHTHQCMVTDPVMVNALLNSGDNVKRRTFMGEPVEVEGEPYIHPDYRWYSNTGTFRRGASFGHVDYSEIAGYAPPDIAYIRTEIIGGRIAKVEKVVA